VTLLIASHDIALIDRLGCRRIDLEAGRLVEQPEDDASVFIDAAAGGADEEPPAWP